MRLLVIFIIGFTAGILFTIHDQYYYKYQASIRLEDNTRKIKNNFQSEVSILKPEDKHSLIDCSDESRIYGSEPLKTYDFMEMFHAKLDPLNGFMYSNGYPLFVYTAGLDKLNETSTLFIGLRGDTAGVHRSLLTPKLHLLHREHESSILLMPGSYAKIGDNLFQSVCHRRNYRNVGYIGSKWPALIDKSWEVYSRLLGNHAKAFIFSYSNGGVARDELLRVTGEVQINNVDISNAFDFSRQYAYSTTFVSPKVDYISGLVDIETNYSRRAELWNLTKFLIQFVHTNPKKLYYAATSLESPTTFNHIYIINALNMIGMELDSGVVRYQNSTRNIIIDIITIPKHDPYSYRNVNLSYQTIFLKNNNVTDRLHTGHYKIIGYAVSAFNTIAKQRKLL